MAIGLHARLGWFRFRPIVGLDIGSSAVKAVELKKASGGQYRVTAFASEPVPPNSIIDGAIADSGAVAGAIRRLFGRKGFRAHYVAASLSGHAVIVKKISLPRMSERELAGAIQWEAEQHIPYHIQDVNLDFQILDPGTGPESRGSMDVLLVAAKRDRIADYTSVIAEAGRQAVVLDVDAFALQNVYEANYGAGPEIVALLNAGASAINVNIVSAGQSLFTRDISLGGNAYTEAVQRELDLPFEAAEVAKQGVGPIEGHAFEEIRPVLQAVTESVLLELDKTFDFFKMTTAAEGIDRIVLSGGASAVDGFGMALAERYAIPVERLDPFRQVTFATPPTGNMAHLASTMAVAVGLALRKAGDA